MTDSVNDEAVYRTAPTTPGLLIITENISHKLKDKTRLFQKPCQTPSLVNISIGPKIHKRQKEALRTEIT